MDEQKTKGEKKPEDTTDNLDEGSELTKSQLIDKQDASTERLEKANAEKAKLQAIDDDRDRRIAEGGTTEAGVTPHKETEDEKWKREAKVRYEGTGMDPTE